MKVNNLLKRIGSVVTTAAMLATLGTTGFAYNPTKGITDSGTDITINSVSVVPVTGATDVYKVTAGYTAAKEQSVGVTMLTYAMTTRDANKSVSDVNITNVSTDGKVTSGAGENMPIIGIDQNAKTVENGTGTFEFTFTTNATNNSYYIAPGKTAIMFISGDNVSTKAAFSFNAPWTATKLDVTQPSEAPSITVAQLRNTATVKNTVKSLSAFNNMSAKVTSSDGANEAATTVSLTGINNDDITIEPTPANNSTAGDYTAKVAANKLVGDSVESAPEATLALEGNVTFNFKVVKEDFTVTSYALNTTDTDKTVYYQPGANQKQAVIDAIKRGIMISGTVGSETKSQTITDITLGEDKIKINEAGTYEADLSGVTLSSDLYDFTGSADKKITGKLAEDTGNKAVLTVGDAGNKITQVEGTATDFIYSTAAYNAAVSEVENEIEGAVSLKKADNTALVKDTDYTLGWSGIDVKNLIATVEEAKLKITLKNSLVFADGSTEKTLKFKINVAAEPAGPFEAKSAVGSSLTYTIGAEDAAIDKVKEALGKEVTVKDEAETKTAKAKVGEWDCKENYDANKPGTYTFKASVTEVDKTKVTLPESGLEATATVTLSPINLTDKFATKSISVKTSTEEDPDNTKLFAAIGNQTINFGEGALADSYTITNLNGAEVNWTGNLTTEGSKATVTYTFAADSTPSAKGLYNIVKDAKVEFTVTVRNSVESNKAWELGNTGEYNAGTVKVYLPTGTTASETAPVEVEAKMYKADGSATNATAKATLKAPAESVDLTFDKSFNAAGINANDKYTVKVTVAGTPLVYKDAENNDADSVQGTVYPSTTRRPSTGGGSTTPEVKSYNVSVKADNNGKATVNKTKATAGETVAVNVEPNEGYKVKEITVKDVNGKSIDVDQKTRTFEMPEGAVTVTVTFEEGTEEPTPDDKGKFKDVPDSFWAAADIYTLREAGIIDGKTADEFDPEGQVTRAEFTKMIVKMFGVEAKDTKVEFADCGEDDWFTPFVAAAVEAGYVKGYSDTEFAPDKVISREEACAILGRAYAKAANSELSFTDKDSIDEYAQPYVALLVEMGFINGYEDGTFRAQNHITRAEAAKIIGCAYRLATASK